MNRHLKRLASLAAVLVAHLAAAQAAPVLPPAPAAAASAPAPAPAGVPAAAPALTAEDLSSFLDGLVPFALRRSDIAGGVIVVVKDGGVLFARGYGYADLERRTPVSPESTLFRPGSTSKLFTWTAVMQQVEQGRLDLDRDVNGYLDFGIPPYQGKPVTLRQLMTHTAGFEEAARGLLPARIEEVGLERYLKEHVPARIFPPGDVVAYSNYGCGLAGYIVQRVSGERFEDYVQRHILQPLGMRHSTFAQPLPPELAPLLAKGYKTASDGKPQPFELVNPAPAGAMSASALDMARFMIAQLQGGRYGDARILQPATAELMHSRQYTPAPGLPGFDLGFYQEDRNGLRIIGHGGDTIVFHSDLHLLLDKDVGVFMSFNSAGRPDAGGAEMVRTAIFHAFLDRYFPYQEPAPPALPTAKADAARVAGWYEVSRRNESAMRVIYLLNQVNVAPQPDGTLVVPMLTDYAGQPLHWRETGPLQYRETDGRNRLSFVTGTDGGIRHWATDYIPGVEVFQRVPAYRSLGSVLWLGGASVLVVLAALLVWLGGRLLRRRYRATLELPPRLRRTRLLSRLGALALFADLLGWVVLIAVISADENVLLQGAAVPWLYVLYVLGVVALLGALAVVVHAVRGWQVGSRSVRVRLGETLLALAVLYLAWFIVAFGLVSFSARF